MSKTYFVLNSLGVVENIAKAESPINDSWIEVTSGNEHVIVGSRFNRETGHFEIPDATVSADRRLITNKGFLKRWTDEEAIAIDIASIHNPNGNVEGQERSAYLRRQKELQSQSNYIDLDDQDTQNGVRGMIAFLSAIGKVSDTEARYEQIINAPIVDTERYSGAV